MKTRRAAIVTGASSGIGLALAERAVRAGWDVVGVGRRWERLEELRVRLADAYGHFVALALDVREAGAPERIVAAALERFERLDVLVNNAGGVAVGPITQQSDDALREQMETHVIVPLALTREALPALRAARGHVFYVGSGVARVPVGMLGAYPPAKAAVRNLARIVRNELRHDDIAVTYIDPGAVASEFMTRAGFAGPPRAVAASPYLVARRIFAAFETRRAVVNAVPWQTAFTALGAALPAATDFILARAPNIVGARTAAATPDSPQPTAAPNAPASSAPAETSAGPQSSALAEAPKPLEEAEPTQPLSRFEAALEPLRNRMRRLNLSPTFVRALLVPGNELELGEAALRWAGMPNKNERALTHDVLEALADAGFLERGGVDRYRVLAAAEDEEPR